jgi:putative membrane protein
MNHAQQPLRVLNGLVFGLMASGMALADVALGAPAAGSTNLAPVDYAFIGSTYLGNKYQVDTGKLGETRAGDPAVKAYAQLMDTSHVQVQQRLLALLRRKGLTPPTLTLTQGAYATIVRILSNERGSAFDHDYIKGQVDYQHANDALYRWEIADGADPDLKAYASVVLPKIDDHMARAQKLDAAGK